MVTINRDWDLLSEELRKESIKDIINFFKNERDDEIGIIAAETVLDLFLQTVGIQIYNKGVNDSLRFLQERFESLEIDMGLLLKKMD